jgi:hypothetical protein
MNIDHTLYQKHCDCEIAVDRNYIPKKHAQHIKTNAGLFMALQASTHVPPALICVTHGCWLKWLSSTQASEIETITKASK